MKQPYKMTQLPKLVSSNMKIKDIMNKPAHSIEAKCTLRTAARKMLELGCGFMPVNENGELLGVITDRDITVRATAKGLSSNALIERVMTKKVITVGENEDVYWGGNLMETHKLRRLVVINDKKEITGIVSIGDIASRFDDRDLSGDIMHFVSS